MDRKAETLGDGPHGLEKMFIARSTRFGVNDHVGGNDLGDALFDAVGEGMDLVEIRGARDADGGVDKITIAGAPEAHAIGTEHAIDFLDGTGDPVLQA